MIAPLLVVSAASPEKVAPPERTKVVPGAMFQMDAPLKKSDAPEPTQSIGERISTTVPTQALAMMNSPFVRQQAEKLASRIRSSKDSPLSAAVDRAYQFAFARLPIEAERQRMLAFLEEQRAAMGGDAVVATDKALIEFCHVLLCLNEFVYVD